MQQATERPPSQQKKLRNANPDKLPKRIGSNISEDERPRFDAVSLRAQLKLYDRTPFLDLLAMWIQCMPTPEAIQEFAERYPDKWASAMANLGKLGGFTEKQEMAIDINVNVRNMSDSQLEDKMNELITQLQPVDTPAETDVKATAERGSSMDNTIIDVECTDVTPEPDK